MPTTWGFATEHDKQIEKRSHLVLAAVYGILALSISTPLVMIWGWVGGLGGVVATAFLLSAYPTLFWTLCVYQGGRVSSQRQETTFESLGHALLAEDAFGPRGEREDVIVDVTLDKSGHRPHLHCSLAHAPGPLDLPHAAQSELLLSLVGSPATAWRLPWAPIPQSIAVVRPALSAHQRLALAAKRPA